MNAAQLKAGRLVVDGVVTSADVWCRIKDGVPPDYTEEEFRTYSAIAFAREQQRRAAADEPAPADRAVPEGLEVREISPSEFFLATFEQPIPTVRGIHRVPLRGPAYDFELVPMEGGRR